MSNRLFIDQSLHLGDTITINNAQHHYLSQVKRIHSGDSITVFNNCGGEYLAIVQSITRQQLTAQLIKHHDDDRLPHHGRHLAIACIKKQRLDWLCEKATELGVLSIQFLHTQYSQPYHSLPLERLRTIAIHACQQSGRNRLPELYDAIPLETFLNNQPKYPLILADASGHTPRPIDHAAYWMIGPEGGFSAEERTLIQSHCQETIRLSTTILRSETAAITALSLNCST